MKNLFEKKRRKIGPVTYKKLLEKKRRKIGPVTYSFLIAIRAHHGKGFSLKTPPISPYLLFLLNERTVLNINLSVYELRRLFLVLKLRCGWRETIIMSVPAIYGNAERISSNALRVREVERFPLVWCGTLLRREALIGNVDDVVKNSTLSRGKRKKNE